MNTIYKSVFQEASELLKAGYLVRINPQKPAFDYKNFIEHNLVGIKEEGIDPNQPIYMGIITKVEAHTVNVLPLIAGQTKEIIVNKASLLKIYPSTQVTGEVKANNRIVINPNQDPVFKNYVGKEIAFNEGELEKVDKYIFEGIFSYIATENPPAVIQQVPKKMQAVWFYNTKEFGLLPNNEKFIGTIEEARKFINTRALIQRQETFKKLGVAIQKDSYVLTIKIIEEKSKNFEYAFLDDSKDTISLIINPESKEANLFGNPLVKKYLTPYPSLRGMVMFDPRYLKEWKNEIVARNKEKGVKVKGVEIKDQLEQQITLIGTDLEKKSNDSQFAIITF